MLSLSSMLSFSVFGHGIIIIITILLLQCCSGFLITTTTTTQNIYSFNNNNNNNDNDRIINKKCCWNKRINNNERVIKQNEKKDSLLVLHSSSSNGEIEEEDDNDNDGRRRIMDTTRRKLQSIYYKSSSAEEERSMLDESTGIFHNLSLWRVPWTELLGRSNVLNVHDPIYTNMFETILNNNNQQDNNNEWYFGHLLMSDDDNNDNNKLRNWKDYDKFRNEINPNNKKSTSSSVVGTLMKISDFRRLRDGRLCLLVQGIERFVVHDVIKSLPYGIADVQLLPDYDATTTTTTEKIQESFQYYHPYEYKRMSLPAPNNTSYMSQTDVYGSWLVDLIPYVPYDLDQKLQLPSPSSCTSDDDNKDEDNAATTIIAALEDDISLEIQLLNHDILRRPPSYYYKASNDESDNNNNNLCCDELEKKLWNAIEDYSGVTTGGKLHPDLACLMPPDRSSSQQKENKSVSSSYPKHRRQRRLSFIASTLIEPTIPKDLQFKQVLLETPSTQERLYAILQWYTLLNAQLIEENFQ